MNVNRTNNIFGLRNTGAFIFFCLFICSYLAVTAQSIKITNDYIFKKNGVQSLSGMVMVNANAFILGGSANAAFKLSTYGVVRGNSDYYVFETNRTNEMQWQQIYGSRYSDRISGMISHAGNLIIAGTTWDLGSRKMDIAGLESDVPLGCRTRIINTNLEGAVNWDLTYDNVPGYNFSYNPVLASKANGGYVVAIQIENETTNRKDIRIFTITPNGEIEWDRKWATDKDKTIAGIVQSDDGGYVLTGGIEAGYARDNTWIMKLSGTGQMIWNITVGAATDEYTGSTPNDLIKTKNGNYLVAGSYKGEYAVKAWLVMVGKNGNVIWEYRYPVGDSDWAEVTCACEAKDGGFILGGGSPKKEDRRVDQPWLIRTNDKGNILYQETLEAERSASMNDIVVIDEKQFAVAGEIDEKAEDSFVPNRDIWFMILEEN